VNEYRTRSSSNSFAKAGSAMIHEMVNDLPCGQRLLQVHCMQNNLGMASRSEESSDSARRGALTSNEKMNAPLDSAKIVRLIVFDDSFSMEFSSCKLIRLQSKVGE